MGELEEQIKNIAREQGAALVGIASHKRLADAPPSGDPCYLLSSARSIISFAIPFDRVKLRGFFSKKDWLSWGIDKKENTQYLYMISDYIVEFLKGKGFEACVVDVNCTYRPEPGAKDITEMVDMYPDFSHRYGAVAAGVGRLGWSGNIITPQYGSAVHLGTVLTSAKFESDPLLQENPCDQCKMCVASCPVEMMHKEETVEVTIAGITETIALKRSNNCCWIGCSGYHGLSPNKKWSNWSPYRLNTPFPEDNMSVDELCNRIRKLDPEINSADLNLYTNYREPFFDPDYLTYSVCGNCANVCWENRKDRIENRKLLAKSGFVVLKANGERAAVHDENDIIEVDTPFNTRVALLKTEYEATLIGKIPIEVNNVHHLWDKEVLSELKKSSSSSV